MSRSEVIRFLVLRSLGNFLVLVALYGVAMTFGPALKYEFQYQVIQYRHIHFIIGKVSNVSRVSSVSRANNKKNTSAFGTHDTFDTLDTSRKSPGFADILAGNTEQVLTPIDPLFSILIPKLGIDEQVVPNVDPDNPQAYLHVLQHAIAHARGSV